jgi:asparagine synthase (glutamine-hydrolysing)
MAYLIDKLKKFQFRLFFDNLKNLSRNYSFKSIAVFYFRLFLPSFAKTLVRRYILKNEDILIGPLDKFHYTYKPQCRSQSCLIQTLQRFHQTTLVNLLHYGDAISMAFSIESRLPFMDYRLVDLAMSLSEDYIIAGGKGKHIQRESMRRILPESIYSSIKKYGFPTPINDFFVQNKLILEESLLGKKAMDRGIFDDKKLRQFIDSGLTAVKSGLLFRFICVELWFQIFIDEINV